MEFNQPCISSTLGDPHLPPPNPNPSHSRSPIILSHYSLLQATRSQGGIPTVYDQRMMASSSPGPRAEPLMMANSMNVHEMLKKEIEREKIRQEIIASDMVRRRIVEAEVRRELMIEREMALRRADNESCGEDGFRTRGSCFSYLDHVDHLLYDRGASLGRYASDAPHRSSLQLHKDVPRTSIDRDRLIVLEKPKPNLSGSKRKAEEPLACGGSESSGVSCRKAPKEDWSCALCHVSMTSEKVLQDHLQGKKHKAKEARLRAEKLDRNKCKKSDKPTQVCESSDTKPQNEVFLHELEMSVDKKLPVEDLIKTCEQGLQKDEKAKKGKLRQSRKRRKSKDCTKFQFWCEVCQIGCHSEIVMENHKLGKKHRERLKDNKLDKEAGDAAPSTAFAETAAVSVENTVEKDDCAKLLDAVNENKLENDADDTEGSNSTWSI